MGQYDAQWKRYRRLRLAHRIGFWGFFPFLFVLAILAQMGVPFPALFIAAYLLLSGVATFRFYFYRCPRCQRFYATTWRYQPMLFARECVHCGLKKFSNGES
jgi:hypothetical protein